jgi:homoserine kinase
VSDHNTVTFQTTPATVRVPATSANLGPGFDAFGLALSRFDEVTAEVTGCGLQISAEGEGAATVPRDERHLIVRSMRAAFDRLGGQPDGLRLNCLNRIPHGRGLGSSAAAIVAGIELARSLVVDGRDLLSNQDALALASYLEGHPDNVAACLLGGMTISWTADDVGRGIRLEPVGIVPIVFIAPDESATAAARAKLPAEVPHADAAFNAARAALLVVAMTGRSDLLMTATQDRLHQGYRADAMPASRALLTALRAAGVPAVISGAGSSVLALASSPVEVSIAQSLSPDGWEPAELSIADGATVIAG